MEPGGVGIALGRIDKNYFVKLEAGQFNSIGIQKNENTRRCDGQPNWQPFFRGSVSTAGYLCEFSHFQPRSSNHSADAGSLPVTQVLQFADQQGNCAIPRA